MKQNTKDWIQYSMAVTLILSSITMGFVAFVVTQDIGAGPLTYIGEALSAALGIFGIGVYAVKKIDEIRTEARSAIDEMRKEAAHEKHQ